MSAAGESTSTSGIFVEAEDFNSYGGWVLDVVIPNAGEHEVWVRAKDWVPSHHPGRFKRAA